MREATANDREEVLRIHDNVYYGLDYIENYYDYFVSSLHTTPFVLLHNDTIVSIVHCKSREREYFSFDKIDVAPCMIMNVLNIRVRLLRGRSGIRNLTPPCCVLEQDTLLPRKYW